MLKGANMRKIGDARYTQVYVCDEPDPQSKACHSYKIVPAGYDIENADPYTLPNFKVDIDFQKGPIKEAGVNGCHHEDLLAIILDRLNAFQESEFKCRENAIAITKIQEALFWLNSRTQSRIKRGVEGTRNV